MLARVSTVIDHSQRTSKCTRNISDTLGYASVPIFLFLPHFDMEYVCLTRYITSVVCLFVQVVSVLLSECLSRSFSPFFVVWLLGLSAYPFFYMIIRFIMRLSVHVSVCLFFPWSNQQLKIYLCWYIVRNILFARFADLARSVLDLESFAVWKPDAY